MIQWNDLIQCWRLAILSSLLCFPSYICTDFSGTRCAAHSAQWNLSLRKWNHKCWYLWSHFGPTPAHLNSELSFHLQRALPLDSTNVHHMQLHVSWQFLGVAMLSRQKGAWRNNSVLGAARKGQVHTHGTSKQKISTHKVLRGGEINFLQGTWCSAGAFANIRSKGNMHSSVVATLG